MSNHTHRIDDPGLAARLEKELEGDVLFDRFSRGRYSTDASIYQIEPIGVVIPRSEQDVARALQIAAEEGVPVIPRGAGTSQSGQTVGAGLIVDTSRHMSTVVEFDPEAGRVSVEPGVVLDRLNAFLEPHGLFFPVDVATAAQATLGGMAGNNSAGARSIRYGLMVDNVRSIDALLADGQRMHFGEVPSSLAPSADEGEPSRYLDLVRAMRDLYEREHEEIARRLPTILRRVAGYNIDRISSAGHNMADLLVGSEGTLAFFTRIELDLQPIPSHKVLGVCHFPDLHSATDSVRHIVELGPTAVELIDRRLLELAGENAAFRGAINRFVRGEPDALLLVEFAGPELDEQLGLLSRLDELMASLGLTAAVVRAEDPGFQQEIWSVRKAGLNIVMSMKGDGKPVSFIEDCAVPLEHLAEYIDRLTEVFRRYGTTGTWYAHASVGCLHVRPTLNLKDVNDVSKMRSIAEEAHAMVREFKGSHSGEHGDGLVRSEFLEPMLGKRIVRAYEEVKDSFDPIGILNPGKIVRAPRMDDRSLFRFKPTYSPEPLDTVLNWSEWGGLSGAVEMCNNNGACLKTSPDAMCPSYRVTRDEQHVTRGRANTLRLALTGQLGPDALTSDEMHQTMDLCVACKACKRECPTGVDMARMKIEFLHHYHQRHGLGLKDRLVAYLPRYAPWAARAAPLLNARNRYRGLAALVERLVGFSARRDLPRWRRDFFRGGTVTRQSTGPEVVLLVDTFNTYFEPENARAAIAVLEAAGYRVILPRPSGGKRPLCCGRTFLSAGLVDEAKTEARRVIDSLKPYVERGVPVVGLEPSCLLTLRDEFTVMLPAAQTGALARRAVLLEEFLGAEQAAGKLDLPLGPLPTNHILVHGHCHQKACGAMDSVEQVLGWIPGVHVELIESSCCGMAGSWGYEAEHYEVSMQMAELSLLPAIRDADQHTWLVADGTSCRRQIYDGSGREPLHAARVLEAALARWSNA